MITIISPAKSVNFDDPASNDIFTKSAFLTQNKQLIRHLKRLNKTQLMDLMSVSGSIAALDMDRYRAFKPPFYPDNAKQPYLPSAVKYSVTCASAAMMQTRRHLPGRV